METKFRTDVHITLLPRARAVLDGAKFQLTPHHQSLRFAQCGDFVHLEGCQALFAVVARVWTVGAAQEEFELVLDLADAAPLLSAVSVPI